ncbi:MAG: VOC family protein [Coriobacteriia bacterium]|nr:VOC family protein [Coriobacteriia bacterium]
MSYEDLKNDTELFEYLGPIVQVGIVVKSNEDIKKGMRKVFGLDPSAESENTYVDTWYRNPETGNVGIIDAPVDALFYRMFNVELEFLAPRGNTDTVWHDYLKETGLLEPSKNPGHSLHHLRFNVLDNDHATELLEARGIKKYMEGRSLVDPTAKFTYYDAIDQLGFVVECVTAPKE